MRFIVSIIIVWIIATYLAIPFYKHVMRIKDSEKKRIEKELDYKKYKNSEEKESGFGEF